MKLIEQQAVLNMLKEECASRVFQYLTDKVKNLPPAQPEPYWIPAIVSPDSDRRVLCLTKTKKGVLNYVLGYYAHDRKHWVCGMNSNVIAWMDLPEPPEEEINR